jgi:hypothetical protein
VLQPFGQEAPRSARPAACGRLAVS